MTTPSMKQIEVALERDDWDKACRLLQAQLKKDPENHWLHTRLATAYYEKREYERSLKASQRAMELAPGCPLVRWDYACALDMLGQTQEAIRQWNRFLKQG